MGLKDVGTWGIGASGSRYPTHRQPPHGRRPVRGDPGKRDGWRTQSSRLKERFLWMETGEARKPSTQGANPCLSDGSAYLRWNSSSIQVRTVSISRRKLSMATDAVGYPISPAAVPGGLAWPGARKVQSPSGMTATTSMKGTNRDGADRAASTLAQERAQARAPEM